MNSGDFRERLKKDLLEAFEPLPWVRTVWEGGSGATGHLDEFSDLDLVMVVEDERVSDALLVIQEKLEGCYGIRRTVIVPEPAWHGHSQRFYFVFGAPPLFYIDLLVEKLSAGNRFLGKARHGQAQAWIDRDGMLAGGVPEEDVTEQAAGFLRRLGGSLPVAATEIQKQIARGNRIDAATQYQRFIGGLLAGLLNIRYRPAKFDFGARYGDREYPEEVRVRLERLLSTGGFDALEEAFPEALAWAEELVRALEGPL